MFRWTVVVDGVRCVFLDRGLVFGSCRRGDGSPWVLKRVG